MLFFLQAGLVFLQIMWLFHQFLLSEKLIVLLFNQHILNIWWNL